MNLRIQSEYRKIRTRKNSISGHFPRSEKIVARQKLKVTCKEQYWQIIENNEFWNVSTKETKVKIFLTKAVTKGHFGIRHQLVIAR